VREYLSQPFVTEPFTAAPSAHVFDGRIYVYWSHDTEAPPQAARTLFPQSGTIKPLDRLVRA
jgi:hypothetical protein